MVTDFPFFTGEDSLAWLGLACLGLLARLVRLAHMKKSGRQRERETSRRQPKFRTFFVSFVVDIQLRASFYHSSHSFAVVLVSADTPARNTISDKVLFSHQPTYALSPALSVSQFSTRIRR